MSESYFTTGVAMAARLTEIARTLASLGEKEFNNAYLDVVIQVDSYLNVDPAGRIATIDRIAAAFDLTAESKDLGGQFHRGASIENLNVFGVVPPPVELRREVLLAQLAQLDAETAATVVPSLADVAAAALTPDADELPAVPKLTAEEDDELHAALGSAYYNLPDPAAFVAGMRKAEIAELNSTSEPVDPIEQIRANGCDAESPSMYRGSDGNYTCRCLVCSRCGKHTGNSSQGHYWAFCHVTKAMRAFHFCCPGDCSLTPEPTPALDAHVAEMFGETPKPLVSDETIRQAEALGRMHRHPRQDFDCFGEIGKTCSLVTVERLAEILANLSEYPDQATNDSAEAIRDYIRSLPEFSGAAHIYSDAEIQKFVLCDGTTIGDLTGRGWTVLR